MLKKIKDVIICCRSLDSGHLLVRDKVPEEILAARHTLPFLSLLAHGPAHNLLGDNPPKRSPFLHCDRGFNRSLGAVAFDTLVFIHFTLRDKNTWQLLGEEVAPGVDEGTVALRLSDPTRRFSRAPNGVGLFVVLPSVVPVTVSPLAKHRFESAMAVDMDGLAMLKRSSVRNPVVSACNSSRCCRLRCVVVLHASRKDKRDGSKSSA
ncbi:hypothetical protein TNIN_84131 [Trichonephila inaurata madagascariensis]|uniref:Uncharacterized protein n=1 Tax=Trichonephila inaurata madagascariensis TaxID=2747483 RepID=A0A8X6WUI8_9ARAC|nr:hypothetical protein TNIN_84131 [Trichonephila inaurata madagascariensis]